MVSLLGVLAGVLAGACAGCDAAGRSPADAARGVGVPGAGVAVDAVGGIEEIRESRRGAVSTPRGTRRGAVTENMKRLAGRPPRLVDSDESREAVTSRLSPGHTPVPRPRAAHDPPPGRRNTNGRRRDDAAARPPGERLAGPPAPRRRRRAGPDRTRRDDHRPARPQPLPVRRRTGALRAGVAARTGGLRAVRPDPGHRGRRGAGRGRGGTGPCPAGPGRRLCAAPAAVVRGDRVGRVRHHHRARGPAGLHRARRGSGRRRRGPAPAADVLGPRGRRTRCGARPARLGSGPGRLGALPHRPADRRPQ